MKTRTKSGLELLFFTDSLEGEKTGIGYYTLGLLSNLQKKFKGKIVLFDKTKTKWFNFIFWPLRFHFHMELTRIWFNLMPFVITNNRYKYIFNTSGNPHYFPFRQKEIFFVHDILFLKHPRFINHRGLSFNKLFFEKSLKNAYKIIVNSNFTKKELLDAYPFLDPKKIHTCFFSYISKVPKCPPLIPFSSPPYILNVNTIEPRKNIIGIIKAFEILKKNKKIAHKLIIVGKLGWKYKAILDCAKKSPYSKDIIFTGYISETEKQCLYKNASVFIYIPFYEGFGIPVLEAMAYGCPTVVSNTSSISEVARNASIYVNPCSLQQIASSLYRIISDKKYQIKMSRLSKKRSKYFFNKFYTSQKMKQLISFLSL